MNNNLKNDPVGVRKFVGRCSGCCNPTLFRGYHVIQVTNIVSSLYEAVQVSINFQLVHVLCDEMNYSRLDLLG